MRSASTPIVSNVVDLLCYRGQTQADQIAYQFMPDGENASEYLTYQDLDHRAKTLALELQSRCQPGDRVLLAYPPGLDFIVAFFGCLYGGMVAVPVYPPRRERDLERWQEILTSSGANLVLTVTSILTNLKPAPQSQPQESTRPATSSPTSGPTYSDPTSGPTWSWLTTDTLPLGSPDAWQRPRELQADTLAFLQYTSGSTGMPKGVMVSHGNLLHNSKVINMGFEDTPQSRGISWLPLHHDMGLIGGMLQPLYVGAPMTFLAPVAFLQRPYRWLQAISKYQATTSGGPNFAYDLCVQKVKPEQLANLDLSHWQVAFVGAEPIRAATLDRFAEKFAPCGFRREAFYASYGLAEATLFVTGGAKTIEPKVQSVQGMALERNEIHLPDSTPTPPVDTAQTDGIRTLVGVGSSKLDQTVRIVDPQTSQPCAAHQVGEIWVTGSSVAQGYWNAPQATAETFQAYLTTGEGPFLRTGDLGFLQGDELFITGRLKDAIIIRGRNHYPQDIEDTVQSSHPALKPDCSAAFVLEQDQKEQLVVVQEVDRNHLRQLNSHEVIRSIRRAVADHHGLQVHETVLIRPGSIPKTSSGKVRRRACRDAFLSGDLRVVV